MSNLENLKKGYQDFATGNMEGVVFLWQPDIEWRSVPGMPYINAEGIYKGQRQLWVVFLHIFRVTSIILISKFQNLLMPEIKL